jgi:hypothetical protein
MASPSRQKTALSRILETHRDATFASCFAASLPALLKASRVVDLDELAAAIRGAEANEARKGPELKIQSLAQIREQCVDLCRALDDKGIGTLRLGRKGRKTRFVFEPAEVQPTLQGLSGEGDASGPQRESAPLRHTFVLRPGLMVALELPEDLTATEAGRLARFVEALSFEGTPRG